MKLGLQCLFALAIYCGTVLSASIGDSSQIQIVRQFNNDVENGFEWGYKLSDEQDVSQTGSTKDLPDGTQVLVVKGSYSYIGTDGLRYTVEYYADETGYHAIMSDENTPLKPAEEEPPAFSTSVGSKVIASALGSAGNVGMYGSNLCLNDGCKPPRLLRVKEREKPILRYAKNP